MSKGHHHWLFPKDSLEFVESIPFCRYGWKSKNSGIPKMDGENNGKPYDLMDDLGGKPHYFRKHPWLHPILSFTLASSPGARSLAAAKRDLEHGWIRVFPGGSMEGCGFQKKLQPWKIERWILKEVISSYKGISFSFQILAILFVSFVQFQG